MISQLTHLNWLSILFAFVAYFMLGYAWYTVLFVRAYKKSLGREHETLPNKPIFIVGPAICTALYTIVSAILIYALNIESISGAMEFSLVVGIGYLLANTINIAINPNMPHPIYYGVITGAYHLVGISIAAVILVLMK
ncbi:MAG: hypothetical protein JWM14_3365 [Chitinophagaceae bacterium]|nr:hypothetical protein [Chitinophagaceae bacterium]